MDTTSINIVTLAKGLTEEQAQTLHLLASIPGPYMPVDAGSINAFNELVRMGICEITAYGDTCQLTKTGRDVISLVLMKGFAAITFAEV